MKKFTFLTLAASSVLMASASTPKQATMSVSNERAYDSKVVAAKKTQLTNNLQEYKVAKSAITSLKSNNETPISRAEATDPATGAHLMYLAPDGAFYPIVRFNQAGSETLYYMNLDQILVPAGKELTFPNFSYTYNAETGLAWPENLDWDWAYYMGLYDSQYLFTKEKASDYDLTATLWPCKALNLGLPTPELTVGENTYSPSYKDGEKVVDMSLVIGGNGGFNQGFTDALISTGKYSNFEFNVMLSNYNAAVTFGSYSEVVGAGKTVDAAFSGTSVAAVRDNHLKSSMEAGGVTSDDFYGISQQFVTGPTNAILSNVTLTAFTVGKAGNDISLTIYQLTPDGESVKLTQVYEALHTLEADAKGWTRINFEIFDEETENEYIVLEPNAEYMFLLSDIEDLDAFIPQMAEFQNNVGEFTADWFRRGIVTDIYLRNGGFYQISADMNWGVQGNSSARAFYPSINFELTLKYPYICPVLYFEDQEHGYYPEIGVSEIEMPLFPYKDEQTSTILGSIYIFSDATAEELKASMEFSSDELKSKINAVVANGKDFQIQGNSYVSKTAQRIVQVEVLEDIPAGSWIKLHNYNETLTINLPAYDMSGIGDVVADGEAVATEYFDLQGRKFAGETNGVVIKKMTMTDGSVKAVKVVK